MRLLPSLFFCVSAVWAQLAAPGESGVAMGHLHLNARDLDAQRNFWVTLGATPVKLGPMEVMKLPGVLVFLRKAEPTGGTDGSTVNHVGFLVPNLQQSLAKWKDAGLNIARSSNQNPHQAFLNAPDDLRVEITEDASLSVPIANHHIHFYCASVDETKAWYAKTFGAKPGKRGRFEAADLPGVNLTFAPTAKAAVGTKGRSLDHIGFEVKDLEAFCKKLEGSGVHFDVPYRKVPALGISIAFFTDPWGTYIELTEGLDRL